MEEGREKGLERNAWKIIVQLDKALWTVLRLFCKTY